MLILGRGGVFSLQGCGRRERTSLTQDYLSYQGSDEKVYLKCFANYKV